MKLQGFASISLFILAVHRADKVQADSRSSYVCESVLDIKSKIQMPKY